MKKDYWIVRNIDDFSVYACKPKKLEFTRFYIGKNLDDYVNRLSSKFLPEVTKVNSLVKMTIDFEILDDGED